MTKQIKQLIYVLWAIEKDLRVIASNKEVSQKFIQEDLERRINSGKFDGSKVNLESNHESLV